MERFKHIELFAGCGGMSLGLEQAGFELYMANELSPMAGETFAFNLLDDNLKIYSENNEEAKKVLWLKSKFNKNDLKSRLRENPYEFSDGKISDINSTIELKNKLIIGNINELLIMLKNGENKLLLDNIKSQEIDLLSGGPPCQSFSLAGLREKGNKKNLLPLSFADFAGMIQPKIVLLENVKGITSPFTIGDHKYYAWIEVAKAFCLKGFVPICFMLNSKYFGIPQNRPRFILLGIREDISNKLLNVLKKELTPSLDILNESIRFYKLVNANREKLEIISIKDFTLYDIEKDLKLFDGELLPKFSNEKGSFISANEAIGDLIINEEAILTKKKKSDYVRELNALFETPISLINKEFKNHVVRKHSFEVSARFQWFQIISNLNGLVPQALKVLSGIVNEETKKSLSSIFEKIKGKKLWMKDAKGERLVEITNYDLFINYIKSIETKKHSQRAIKANEPAPAQMTIPDDLCHYSSAQLRTLTVREMARFQSFPDWFEFRSKITTGGDKRSYEIPQYTQVGNAVPPRLAYELGKTISKILSKVDMEGQNSVKGVKKNEKIGDKKIIYKVN